MNFLFAHDTQLGIMKFSLNNIKIHSKQFNNLKITKDLKIFLKAEAQAKLSTSVSNVDECLDRQGLLASLLEELKASLYPLLQSHEMFADEEIKNLMESAYSFKFRSRSLIDIAEEHPFDRKIIADVEVTLLDVITEYLEKIRDVRDRTFIAVEIVHSLANVLDAHLEWSDVGKKLSLVQKKQMALVDFILQFNGIVAEVSDKLEEISEVVGVPEPEIIRYGSIGNIETSENSRQPRISMKLMNRSSLLAAEEMAKSGYKVLLVDGRKIDDHDHAILQERYSTPNKAKIGILYLSPLQLSRPKYSRLIDEYATSDDGSVVLNVRGHEMLKKRLFLPFKIAEEKEYEAIVFDCNFGEGDPYNINPVNLGYSLLAATAAYAKMGIEKFVISGDIDTDYCRHLVSTMSQFIKKW